MLGSRDKCCYQGKHVREARRMSYVKLAFDCTDWRRYGVDGPCDMYVDISNEPYLTWSTVTSARSEYPAAFACVEQKSENPGTTQCIDNAYCMLVVGDRSSHIVVMRVLPGLFRFVRALCYLHTRGGGGKVRKRTRWAFLPR